MKLTKRKFGLKEWDEDNMLYERLSINTESSTYSIDRDYYPEVVTQQLRLNTRYQYNNYNEMVRKVKSTVFNFGFCRDGVPEKILNGTIKNFYTRFVLEYVIHNDLYQKFNDEYMETVFRNIADKCRNTIINHSTLSSMTDSFSIALNLFLNDIDYDSLRRNFVETDRFVRKIKIRYLYNNCVRLIKVPLKTILNGGNVKLTYSDKTSKDYPKNILHFGRYFDVATKAHFKSEAKAIISEYMKDKFIKELRKGPKVLSENVKSVYLDIKSYFWRNGCGYNDMLNEHIVDLTRKLIRLNFAANKFKQLVFVLNKHLKGEKIGIPMISTDDNATTEPEVSNVFSIDDNAPYFGFLRDGVDALLEVLNATINQEEYYKSNFQINRSSAFFDESVDVKKEIDDLSQLLAMMIAELSDEGTTYDQLKEIKENLECIILELGVTVSVVDDNVDDRFPSEDYDDSGVDEKDIGDNEVIISNAICNFHYIHCNILDQLRSRMNVNCFEFEYNIEKKIITHFNNDVLSFHNFYKQDHPANAKLIRSKYQIV